ncbi:iron ABC transporter substrate-binding protein [Haloprofundus marisrubri]|uniref:Iron ABC transporter substrate-binding protein n=1 Tax=Haloprofundus marisrubri TaxID=1514971 RepID=A0A0W1R9E9_9EURY|nr:iron ABC transporter substrate-binding protein [Haloprofundus marisrubri]KTG09966.1 iron ABC transporter substrate-binding protein [Haloprofundus marisrubri]
MERNDTRRLSRRRLVAAGVTAGITGLAGCNDILGSGSGGGGTDNSSQSIGQIGSGRSPFGDRSIEGGTSMAAMPALSGELTVYSGRGEALVGELVGFIDDLYDDFSVQVRYAGSSDLVNQILTEGDGSPADVFYSVNAGSLGTLAEEGRTSALPDDVLELVRDEFQDPDGQWTGTSGRARTIPYNTDQWSESDIPTDISAFPDTERFADEVGWAPTYGSFQAFVTAMRVLRGDEETRQWLQGMLDLGVQEYSDEFLVCQAIADGEISVGFANHYYIQRILAGRGQETPLATAFTNGDAGSIFNVAGACTLNTSDKQELGANFVRHLLSAEAQDYFARETFEYPLVSGVDPVGDLPRIDELNPPQGIDLTELADLEATVDLMRDVGVL